MVMIRYHQLNAHESEQTPKMVKDREAWFAAGHGVTETDMTEQLNKGVLILPFHGHTEYFSLLIC